MTQDEIIRMAIDAGLGEYLHLDGWRFTPDGDDIKSLERFYELAYATGAAHEREAWQGLFVVTAQRQCRKKNLMWQPRCLLKPGLCWRL